ncbi:MAG: transcriptional regulator [Deltaproteobacteria bacterium]|nr:transcriptional regulator [Deltaproteobacteria bacterium]
MDKLINNFLKYVSKVSGETDIHGLRLSERLPQYLSQQYAFLEIRIGERQFLGVLLKEPEGFRPVAFSKHFRQIMMRFKRFEGYCLVARKLPSYVRKRMIEKKIPFVVPDHQLFWPELGLAIQERNAKTEPVPVSTFSPATQAVIIYALTANIISPVTPKLLAEELGYTAMTMSRASDEIVANELGQEVRFKRDRLLIFIKDKKGLWEAALPYLRDPVRETVRIKKSQLITSKIKAGETALATISMLASPKEPIYALGRHAWKNLADKVELVPIEDEDTCKIQLWRYDPVLFAKDGIVDRFSLYLSLRNEQDERVQAALEEMMEKIKW